MQRIGRFFRVSQRQFDADFRNAFRHLPHITVPVVASIPLPVRATVGSAGYDFFSPVGFSLAPGESILIPTGIRVIMDEGWVLAIFPRSGLGFKYRLQLDNTVGIIDSDYAYSDNEGHILFRMTNDSRESKKLHIHAGDAIAQGVFLSFGITEDDQTTMPRNGGLGSTSVRKS